MRDGECSQLRMGNFGERIRRSPGPAVAVQDTDMVSDFAHDLGLCERDEQPRCHVSACVTDTHS